MRTLISAAALMIAAASALASCSGDEQDTGSSERETLAATNVAEDSSASLSNPEFSFGGEQLAVREAEAESSKVTPASENTPPPQTSAMPPPEPAPTQAAQMAMPAAFAQCGICHTVERGGQTNLGPNLWGVFGARAGQGSFAYSDALNASGIVWNEQTLDAWLGSPQGLVPGNLMAIPGEKDPAQRQEIIEYLKQMR